MSAQHAAEVWRGVYAASGHRAHGAGLAAALTTTVDCLQSVGRHDEAFTAIDEALATCQRLTQDGGDVGALEHAAAMNRKALLFDAVGRSEEALPLVQEAAALAQSIVSGSSRARAATAQELATAYTELGRLLSIHSRHEEAAVAYQEAVAACNQLRRRWSYLGFAWVNGAAAQTCLAEEYVALGRPEDALNLLFDAAEVLRRFERHRGSPGTTSRPTYARLLTVSARARADLGDHERAGELAGEAVACLRRLAADEDKYQAQLAWALRILGGELRHLGHDGEAVAVLREAVGICRPLVAATPHLHDCFADALSLLAASLVSQGRLQESLDITAELDAWAGARAEESAEQRGFLAGHLSIHGVRLALAGRNDEARAHHQEAVAIARRLADDDPAQYEPALAKYLHGLADHCDDVGDNTAARVTAEEAAAIRRRLIARGAGDEIAAGLVETLIVLSIAQTRLGDKDTALAVIDEAVTTARTLADTDEGRRHLALALQNQAVRLCALHRYDEALDRITEAGELVRLVIENDSNAEILLGQFLRTHARVLAGLRRFDEALDVVGEARALFRRLVATDRRVAHELARCLALTGICHISRNEPDQAIAVSAALDDLVAEHPDNPGVRQQVQVLLDHVRATAPDVLEVLVAHTERDGWG